MDIVQWRCEGLLFLLLLIILIKAPPNISESNIKIKIGNIVTSTVLIYIKKKDDFIVLRQNETKQTKPVRIANHVIVTSETYF